MKVLHHFLSHCHSFLCHLPRLVRAFLGTFISFYYFRNVIDKDTINRIMGVADIVEVVSEFVTLRKAGVNFKGLCPFHNEKTPSFVVSPAKQFCKCFSCGKGGSTVHFLMEHEQLTYPEAIRWLGRKYGIEVQEKELSAEERAAQSTRESMFILNEWANHFFQDTLHHHSEGQTIGLSYFRSRGFRDDIIKKFQLGYSTTPSLMPNTALTKGYQKDYLLKTGLCYEKENGQIVDRYHGRVIFPIHTLSGKVVAFGGRILGDKKNVAKYVNSPESDIYNKSRELYGLFQAKHAIVKQDRCYLVEGYTDVISMHQSGIENVVASSGTSLTEGQIRLIHRFTNNITILYDGDSAGIKASVRGIDMLLEEGMNIKVLLLPNGEDPDSFAQKQTAQEFVTYIESHHTDFIRFKINLLSEEAGNDPIKRATMIADVVNSVSVIPEGIVRQTYARECATLLNISEAIILDEITKFRRKRFVEKEQRKEGKEGNIPITDNTTTKEEASLSHYISHQRPSDYEEKLLVELIIRHGGRWLESDNDHALTVAEFLSEELSQDGLHITNETYKKVFEEALHLIQTYRQSHHTAYAKGEFLIDTFAHFLSHSDITISQLAAACTDDTEQLSHSQRMGYTEEKDRLEDFTLRILYDFKLAKISKEVKLLRQQLQSPEIKSNISTQMDILKRIKALSEVERQLSQVLGDRVISR